MTGIKGATPGSLREFIKCGLLTVASQPKNNAVDLDNLSLLRLYVFLIDHDYPGGSAAMHNAVFDAYGLPYRSCFMIGDPARAGEIFRVLRNEPVYSGGGAGSGFKDKIGPFLDRLDGSAETIGSVNVIARDDGGFAGYNTDGAGFVAGLLDQYPDCVAGKKIVILGAGGTALPIAYELAKRGPAEIVILNRTIAKAAHVAQLIAPFCAARAAGEEVIGGELAGAASSSTPPTRAHSRTKSSAPLHP